ILFTAAVNSGLKNPALPNGDGHLNNDWHRLKSALLNAARCTFPKRVISLNKPQAVPFELRPIIHLSHKLDHYIKFTDLFIDQSALIDILLNPALLYSFVSGKVTVEFYNHKQVVMKAAIAKRNSNFYEDKEKFICSSLNREKCSIVLDRVLITNIPGNPQ
ncbi:17567_t:CDS:2, partial [Rhizophagus irregularis]